MTFENFSRGPEQRRASERAFGLVMAAACTVFALLPLLRRAGPRLGWLAAAAVFCLVAFTAPRVLAPLHTAWAKLGLLLHRVTNPLITGLLFYGVVTPLGALRRAVGSRGDLQVGCDAGAASYWIERRPPGPPPESMANQF